MSRHDPLWYLRDMIAYGHEAMELAAGRSDPQADSRVLFLAAERLLEIMGEAARAIPADLRDRHADVPWAKFTGMRNVLIHAYHRVDPDEVWRTVTDDLPKLVPLIERALLTEEERGRTGPAPDPGPPSG
ncbi:MAG: DUF86 domain-containing protein [Dehalococcoidia bacterium]